MNNKLVIKKLSKKPTMSLPVRENNIMTTQATSARSFKRKDVVDQENVSQMKKSQLMTKLEEKGFNALPKFRNTQLNTFTDSTNN